MTDLAGNLIYQNQRVHFNEEGLKEVARIADGKFYRATDTRSLEQIYAEIDTAREIDREREEIRRVSTTCFPCSSWAVAGCFSRRCSCARRSGRNCHEFRRARMALGFAGSSRA